jgi:hypothetical protein
VSDRPYQDYSQAEIVDLKRESEREQRSLQKELDQLYMRGRGRVSDDVMQRLGGRGGHLAKQIALMEKELLARRDEHAAGRAASSSHGRSAERRRPELVALACACAPPRRIKVPAPVLRAKGTILCEVCHRPFER